MVPDKCKSLREMWYCEILISKSSKWQLSVFRQKPLTMYFLRKAQALINQNASRTVSPLYWEAAGISSSGDRAFEAIMPGIEHPLGVFFYPYLAANSE